MAFLPPSRGDKTKALFVLAQLGLSKSSTKVGASLVWRANQVSGRCDPSIARIAHDTGSCERSVYSAVRALSKVGFLTKNKYGGGALTNAYSINWPWIRSKHEAWEVHCAARGRQQQASENQPPLNERAGVAMKEFADTAAKTCTQTLLRKPIEPNSLDGSDTEVRGSSPSLHESKNGFQTRPEPSWWTPRPISSREVRLNKAAQALDASLRALGGDAYGLLLDAISEETFEKATIAEMQKPGSGRPLILDQYYAKIAS